MFKRDADNWKKLYLQQLSSLEHTPAVLRIKVQQSDNVKIEMEEVDVKEEL